jgi:acetyltransferase (GNAT) family protein
MTDPAFRPCTPADWETCIEIFKSNTPRYFGVEELSDFGNFLATLPYPYYVVTRKDKVVACGGYAYHGKKQAVVLVWGMVHAELHKHGLGEFLLVQRLKQIRQEFPETLVQIETSQHSRGFFEKYGFEAKEITEDFFAPGIDRVIMDLTLTDQILHTYESKADISS